MRARVTRHPAPAAHRRRGCSSSCKSNARYAQRQALGCVFVCQNEPAYVQVYYAHYEASRHALHTTPERKLFCRAYSALRQTLVVACIDQRYRRLIAPRTLEARLRATREFMLLVIQV